MAKRTSRSRASDAASGAPAEPRAPATPQAERSRSRRATGSSEPPQDSNEIVASEIENPRTISKPAASAESDRLNASEPTEEEIRLRAYQRFLERGGAHGDDFNDWLAAERELKKL